VRCEGFEGKRRGVGGLLVHFPSWTLFHGNATRKPAWGFRVGSHDGSQSGALDTAIDGVCDHATPGQNAEAEEAENGTDADEDGAFWVAGLLHKRSGGGVGDDEGGDTGTGNGGEASQVED